MDTPNRRAMMLVAVHGQDKALELAERRAQVIEGPHAEYWEEVARILEGNAYYANASDVGDPRD